MAWHLEQACLLSREVARSPIEPPIQEAAAALADAARRAERRESLREAHRYYTRALEVLQDNYEKLRVELRLRRADMAMMLGQVSEATDELLEVADDASKLGRLDVECEATLLLGDIDQRQGRPSEAHDRLTEAHRLAIIDDDPYLRVRVAFVLNTFVADHSGHLEQVIENLRSAIVTADEISKNQEYLALNAAKGVGRFHVIDKLDDTVEIGYNEILVLKEVPLDLPPVAGIIISQPTSPLSHINLLAKGWNIPNAYIKNANDLFRKFDGYWFEFETTLTDYKYSPCTLKCLDEKAKIAPAVYGADQFRSPPSNLSVTKLLSLSEIRAKDSNIFGSKAANLGELVHSRPTGFSVPAGFGIPFIYYKRFMESNRFFDVIGNLMNDQEFVHNPSVRRKKLDEFRRQIQTAIII